MSDAFWKRMTPETQAKLEILERYLSAYGRILGSVPGIKLFYIDGFAGKGRYDLPDLDESAWPEGSPLKALRVSHKLIQEKKPSLQCAFIENNPENHTNLTEEVDRVLSSLVGVEAPIIHLGKFEHKIDQVLAEGPQGKVAKFIFVDPFGYSDIPIDLIARLADQRWHEMFITFMSKPMNRFLADPTKDSTRDKVFGSSEWRHCKNTHDLVHLYARTLVRRQKSTEQTYVFPFEVRTGSTPGEYHMLHVCHDVRGREVMGKAVSASSLFFSPNTVSLFADPAIEKEILRQLEQVQSIRALDLAGKLWLQEPFWSMCWKGDFARAIMDLEEAKKILIKRQGKTNRRTGLNPSDDYVSIRRG